MRGFRSFYYTHTYLYLHDRIRVNRFVPVDDENKLPSDYSRKSVGKNNIFSPGTTPHRILGGVVWGENASRQLFLESSTGVERSVSIRAWRCRVLEKEAGHEWIVKVSDDAFPDSNLGWICDCGNWTFGDDMWHIPVFGRVGKVVHGRLKVCRR
ncbi:MAG: hypothetical protein JSW60_07385 [Thermoplasmatales archaeon]|nr:MAG: hypothetical protein JSW60_07385 [Thermoplasmatales archaeon]